MARRRLCMTILLCGLAGGCVDNLAGATGQGGGTGSTAAGSTTAVGPSTTTGSGPVDTTSTATETTAGDSTGVDCEADGTCTQIDLLIVIDDSSTMVEEQGNVAANLSRVVERIEALTDATGDRLEPSVNIMVTTTDTGSCASEGEVYPPAGTPVVSGCNARLEDFTGDGADPVNVEAGCTELCPEDVVPTQHFIHFDALGTNVPEDDVAAALHCLGPQGIRGCEYEAPLEAMRGALDPTACWNDPSQPRCASDPAWATATEGFLRDSATLVVMIIADEADCSVSPRNFDHFTDDDAYWEDNPATMLAEPSSAMCWNAGAQCEDENDDGVYESCVPSDTAAVLHPLERYASFLRQIREEQGKDVRMLGVLGVPPVTAHNRSPPFEPIEGGVLDLSYRDWTPEDLLPAEVAAGETVETKRFSFGRIAPGCSGSPAADALPGRALPPTRVREVCESLNVTDDEGVAQVGCCIESICDDDFSRAVNCLVPSRPGFLPPKG